MKIKRIVMLYIVLLALSFLLCLVFVNNIVINRKIDMSKYEIENIDNNYCFDISLIESNGTYLNGYIYENGKSINTSSIKTIIYNNEESYIIPTSLLYIENLNNNPNEDNADGWYGYYSLINEKLYKNDNKVAFLIKTDDYQRIVLTNTMLKDIKVVYD